MKRSVAREWTVVLAVLGVAMVLVSSVRRHLFSAHKSAKETRDVYFLPPPNQVVKLSLGYRHAVADMIWAHVLVSQGLHTFQQRHFSNLTRLYDVITTLTPTWRTPYLLSEALITFQTGQVPYAEVVKTREILELGTRNLPLDGEIWLSLGQFVSFMAPSSYLDDKPEVAARWRQEGVKYLARATELGAGQSHISWQALGGANILAAAGKRDEAIRFLQLAYAVSDDAEFKADVEKRLARYRQQDERDARLKLLQRKLTITEDDQQRRKLAQEINRLRAQLVRETNIALQKAFRQAVSEELPWIGRNQAFALGPAPHPALCAGRGHDRQTECATTWKEWARRQSALNAAP